MQVAVITGASTGIGAAIARELAARGWKCILLARREELLRELAEEIGGEWERCDVSDRAEVDAVAARVRERHPQIALLVNNAGMPGRSGFMNGDPERIETVMRVNYLGSVWCLRAFAPALEANGGGDVVNIVSVAGTIGLPVAGPYAASKHAQLAFSRSVTLELKSKGIRVHTVNPGFVESEGFPQKGVLRPGLILHAVLEPPDIAKHVLKVLDRNKRETFVPRWYRVAAVSQAVVPGIVSWVLGRMSATRSAE